MPIILLFSFFITFASTSLQAENQTYPIAPLFLRYQIHFKGILTGVLVSANNVRSWYNVSAMVLARYTPPIEPAVRALLSNGPKPMVLIFREPSSFLLGKTVFLTDASDSSDISVPCVSISAPNWDMLYHMMLVSNVSVTAVIDLDVDSPAWDEAYSPQMITFQVLISIGAFLCLCFGVWRWSAFIIQRPLIEFSVANVAYAMIVVGSILRLVICFDLSMRQLYDYRASLLLFSLSYPFALMVNLLLALFWHEALTLYLTVTITPFLSKMKIPFYVICSLLFISEVIGAVIRTYNPTIYTPFSSIIYLIGQSLIGMYFVYMAVRVLVFIKAKEKKRVRRTVNYVLVVISCIIIFLSGISLALWTSSVPHDAYTTTVCGHIAIFINFTALNIMTIAQSFAFSAAADKRVSTSNELRDSRSRSSVVLESTKSSQGTQGT